MKFKIDENLPVEISEILTDADYDSKTVNNQKLQGSKDSVIIEICKSEQRVLTFPPGSPRPSGRG